jgi:ubiquinone biosynthesis accessory factor UbiJ
VPECTASTPRILAMPIPSSAALLSPLIERAVLLGNHVLRTQPTATDRLAKHTGRSVTIAWRAAVGGWPTPPAVHLLITPAGLLERIDDAIPADVAEATVLRVCIELPAPHRVLAMVLAGERPRVDVDGDAQFAADVAWLADHLRWDVEHDMARVVGDMPARFLAQAVHAAAQAARALAKGVASTWERRPETFERRPETVERRPGAGAASTR